MKKNNRKIKAHNRQIRCKRQQLQRIVSTTYGTNTTQHDGNKQLNCGIKQVEKKRIINSLWMNKYIVTKASSESRASDFGVMFAFHFIYYYFFPHSKCGYKFIRSYDWSGTRAVWGGPNARASVEIEIVHICKCSQMLRLPAVANVLRL